MDATETTTIGSTDVTVTRLGLGSAPLGGWPTAVDADTAHATVRRAWEAGLRYYDTAPYYGHGRAEELLGDVLRERPRGEFTLSTKVGRVLVPEPPKDPFFAGAHPLTPVFDFSAEGVRTSLRESRRRLGLERVDIVLIHDPDDHHTQAVEEAYPVLADLRENGEIEAVGVGMNASEPLRRFAEEADFDCFLLAGRYTLLEQDSLDLLEVARQRNMSIIIGGVYNSGLLVDPKPGAPYNYQPAPDDVIARAQRLEEVCAEFEVPLRAAALQFPLAHPAVACVLNGARTPAEVDDNLAMFTYPIPAELWSTLKERELIHPDAPTPTG